jgi:hypothetical protein
MGRSGRAGYIFGGQINRVAGPIRLLSLLGAVVAVATGVIYFRRRYEKDLEQRADAAIPEPWPG